MGREPPVTPGSDWPTERFPAYSEGPIRPVRGRSYPENARIFVNCGVGLSLGAAILLSSSVNFAYAKPFMIVGIDEKVSWDDDGKTILSAPGKDQVLIVDLASPESPKIVAAAILRGSNMKKAFYYNKNGSLSVLKIDGKKVSKTQNIEVGGLPEAVMFTPDGKYILAGNYMTQDFSILQAN